MSVADVQLLSVRTGVTVVPPLGDYDGASSGWTEAEYRARLIGTSSVAGFWTGEPGWVAIESWPYNEVCVILRGRVAIEAADGSRAEHGPGSAFVVPFGFRGVWHTLEPTEKVFVGVVPDLPRT